MVVRQTVHMVVEGVEASCSRDSGLTHGSTEDVLSSPKHPYTKGLLSSTPSIERARDEALYQIPGAMPRPGSIPEGCPFAPRCDRVMDQCRAVRPELRSLSGDREAACYLFDEAGEIA